MQQAKLNYLFALVQQETKYFKTKHPQGDGRAFWQPLKQLLKAKKSGGDSLK